MGHASEYDRVLSYLSPCLRTALAAVSRGIKDETTEIRLRLGQPPLLTGHYGQRKIPHFIIKKEDMEYCFSEFCRHSVYSYKNELREGYITLEGGHRVGISGRYTGGDIPSELLSFCIRIAGGEVLCDGGILSEIKKDRYSVLICGEPGSGKTTVLRNIIPVLGERISVIDERDEICGGYRFDCDVFSGIEKSRGIEAATRCFAPDTVICDEIGACEAEKLYNAAFSGVRLIATVHASGPADILRKPFLKGLIEGGVFGKVIILRGRSRPSEMERAYYSYEIIGDNPGVRSDNSGGFFFEKKALYEC